MTRTVLLDEFVDFQEGPGILAKDFHESGVPLIRLKGLEKPIASLDGCNYLDPDKVNNKWSHFKLKAGDLLLSTSGTLGRVSEVDQATEGSVAYTGIIRFRPKDETQIDRLYLKHYLSSQHFKNQATGMAAGSVLKHFGPSHLRKMHILLPEIEIQKKIGQCLTGIDEKIELNRKMNETLEQMGQALFRHYFIKNPEAKKWNERELGNFFPIKTGKKDANFSTKDGEYPFFTCAQAISKAPDFSFDAHALLLAGNGDFNLKLYRGKFEAYQRTYVLIPDDERLVGLLYFLMKMKLTEITGGSRGSVIKFITKGMIENYKFALPDHDELVPMGEVFNQLTVNIEENNIQIQTLTTLRDTLLPRLMSGRVSM